MKRRRNTCINAIDQWPLQLRAYNGRVTATHKSRAADAGLAVFVLAGGLALVPAIVLYQLAPHIGASPHLLTASPFIAALVLAIAFAVRTHRSPEWDVFTVCDSGTIRACVPGMWSIDIEEYSYDRDLHAVALSKVDHRLQPKWSDRNWLGFNPMCATLVISIVEQDTRYCVAPLVKRAVARPPFVSHDRYVRRVRAVHQEMARFTGELAHALGISFVEIEAIKLNTNHRADAAETTIDS